MKKSQAALEFLTTYGWAFLVILLMISALGYFGILNPTKFLPERCITSPEFVCEEYSMDTYLSTQSGNDLLVYIILRNNLQTPIKITNTDFVKFSGDLIVESGFIKNIEFHNSIDTIKGTPNICIILHDNYLFDTSKIINAGETIYLFCSIGEDKMKVNPSSIKGSKKKIEFKIDYTPQGKTISKQITGELFTTVQ